MRITAFVALGVCEVLLIFWRLGERVAQNLVANWDVSDWIALCAVMVALGGLRFARRAAVAAESSSNSASRALDIAKDSAESAAISARATEKSADADSRMAAIAEANQHDALAPKWLIEVGEPGERGILLRLRYEEGPYEVEVDVTTICEIFEITDQSDTFEVHLHRKRFHHPVLHPHEMWEVRIDFEEGWKISHVEAMVSIQAIDLHVVEREPWFRVQHCYSPRRKIARARFIE
ncbi:hypothetical protein FKR81_37660 [Lentzea tibetensis]|uniref:Uncharacterized protein n=1 Tax=Lentzea tibetensis TaxID=2591470 RepID=A0A563EH68_9PSEU|nr:hypothetical protein [Lentzea tibetensis]TWP45951.1 hypothetical protein FKR81_37660 [Lentzea tibetensis]